MSEKGWVGFDLDGTLAHYDGWRGELHIGEPIPRMVEAAQNWIRAGYEVRIFTARAHSGIEAQNAIKDWTEKHIGVRLAVTATKDFKMICLYDDRAVQIEPNTGRRVDGKS